MNLAATGINGKKAVLEKMHEPRINNVTMLLALITSEHTESLNVKLDCTFENHLDVRCIYANPN